MTAKNISDKFDLMIAEQLLAVDDVLHDGALTLASDMHVRVPKDTGKTAAAIKTKKTKKGYVVILGDRDFIGFQQEYGNVRHAAQPFVRPAWDSHVRSIRDKAIAAGQAITKKYNK